MRIRDGQPEDHPTPLALDPSSSPGVAPAGVREPAGGAQAGTFDAAGFQSARLAAGEADWQQAMSEGMAADAARRQHYVAAMAPLGASAGDQMNIPPVPAYQLPPPPLAGYPYSGDEPVG
jgi:hypothetical protein